MVNETLSHLELAWDIISLLGFIPCLFLLGKFIGDYLYIRRNNVNGNRRTAARYRVLISVQGTVILFIFLLIGLIQSFIPNAIYRLTFASYVFIFGLFVINIFVTGVQFYTYFERRKIEGFIAKRAILSSVRQEETYSVVLEIIRHIDELHELINANQDKLVAEVKAAAHARGVLEEKERQEEHPHES